VTPVSTPGLPRTRERSRCIGAADAGYRLRVPGPGCDRPGRARSRAQLEEMQRAVDLLTADEWAAEVEMLAAGSMDRVFRERFGSTSLLSDEEVVARQARRSKECLFDDDCAWRESRDQLRTFK
jgi:hypothetical protein